MSVHPTQTHDSSTDTKADAIKLAHSVVELERGPAGVIARVQHRSGRVDHAGPLPDATIAALREVGE